MPRRGRYRYETVLDKDELQQQQLQKSLLSKSWVVLAVVAVVGISAIAGSLSNAQLEDRHAHTIPTLLSVVHHETGEYLVSLNNPLYQRLHKATFTWHDAAKSHQSMVESPTLQLDRSKMGLRDPLTLSWTMGRDQSGASILKDDDALVLYCGDQNLATNIMGKSSFLEAATIAQARATSRRQNGYSNGDDHHWHFSSFPILRHEICQFHLYQALPDDKGGNPVYALLDTSNVVQIESSRAVPTAIHLALGNDPSEMVVQFTTGDQEGTPVARYSKQENNRLTDPKKVEGTSHTYTADDMCGAPANTTEAGKFQSPGMIHVIRLTDLEPNTEYEYKVGLAHGQGITWSDSFLFMSAQATGDTAPFSYLVYGDQGCPSNGWGDGGKWTAAMTAREVLNPKNNLPIRAVHHFGDLSYARGAAHIWDEWLNMISSFTTKVPLMVGVGNHEYDHASGGANGKDPSGVPADDGYRPAWGNFGEDSGGECGIPPSNHFTMPNSTGSNGIFWYSFDFGIVHTVVVSSEHDMAPGSLQYQWLQKDLQSVNRTLTPWLVLELHRPLYESQKSWADNAVGIVRRMQLDDLLGDYQVDLVLGGHYHSYLRTCDGLRRAKCNNGGPLHITVGSAGAELTIVDQYPNGWTDKLIRGEFGYGRITVSNASAMLFEFVKAGDENDSTAGEVHDSMWIKRDR